MQVIDEMFSNLRHLFQIGFTAWFITYCINVTSNTRYYVYYRNYITV